MAGIALSWRMGLGPSSVIVMRINARLPIEILTPDDGAPSGYRYVFYS